MAGLNDSAVTAKFAAGVACCGGRSPTISSARSCRASSVPARGFRARSTSRTRFARQPPHRAARARGADRAAGWCARSAAAALMSRPRACPIRSSAHTRFSEIVGAAGRQAGGRLIGSAVEAASEHIARRLQIAPGTPVIRLEILRSVDRMPISVGTTWLPVGARAEGRAALSRDALDHAHARALRHHRLPAA